MTARPPREDSPPAARPGERIPSSLHEVRSLLLWTAPYPPTLAGCADDADPHIVRSID